MAQSPRVHRGHELLRLVARKYIPQLITLLDANGPMRFTEIQETLEAGSSSTLAEHLDELADAGFIERRAYDEIPLRVEYELTPMGHELNARLETLLEWLAET